jgi:hypothetical protein
MNKSEYAILNNSEYRMSISLWSCNTVSIKGLVIDESGGDGIYIGGNGSDYCQNILVEDVQCIKHYRQGMSIANVQNMTVRNSYFANTQGTLPEAGIDIEPYQTTQRIVNLKIEDCRFENNGWAGIAMALEFLDSSSIPISIEIKDAVLKNNSLPTNAYGHCEIFVSADDFIPVKGTILFQRCFIEESQYSAFYSRKTANAFSVKFKDCVFQNVSKLQTQYNEPIFLEVPSYTNPSPYLGGLIFDDVFVSYSTNFSFFRVFGWSTLLGIKDITGNFTVVEPNNNSVLYTNVPDTVNCTYTFSNQTSLPSSIVGINAISNTAIECNQQNAIYKFERSSINTSYPIGISYSNSGTASLGNDTHLQTKGAVIPANNIQIIDSIYARNDGMAETTETISFLIQNSSFYTLTANSTKTFDLMDCLVLAISELEKEMVNIYPNPANTYLTIKNKQNQPLMITIVNALGAIVQTKKISSTTETIDVKYLPSGLYFVKVINKKTNKTITKKIIKE